MRVAAGSVSSSVMSCLLAACAGVAANAIAWPPQVEARLRADAKTLAAYHFALAGRYDDDLPLVSFDGWIDQQEEYSEFQLYYRRSDIGKPGRDTCLSGVFDSVDEFARANRFRGRHFRVFGTYGPTGIDDGEPLSTSTIHNSCVGAYDIHAKMFVIID